MINKLILKECCEHGFTKEELYVAYKLFFGTLVSEPRLKIINLLRAGKKSVSEITSSLKMDQTLISHNLARLKKCGFVISEIEGKFRYYRLNDKTINPLMDIIETHMSKYCIHILRELKREKQNEK